MELNRRIFRNVSVVAGTTIVLIFGLYMELPSVLGDAINFWTVDCYSNRSWYHRAISIGGQHWLTNRGTTNNSNYHNSFTYSDRELE